ncbi:class I SAM-dependent methyltransferase [Polaribacter sp. BM10]|uniref:class I SAM-dependent methyltransferase n=1 Tax=Polaribacter sp. BM10 TaxID=1529069 RepID=UPI0011EA53FE|nr:class I SAM-dependent methyltransferase [Polaribacter sp. BM10]
MLSNKLRKLKKTIKEIDKIHRSNDDAYALQFILKLFPEYSYLPFTPFSLNPFTILHILNDILFNDRKQILEFGSGISTIIISRFIKINNLETKILSFDNNEGWLKIISKELEKYNCSESVNLVHSELSKHNKVTYKKYNNEYWYDLNEVNKNINTLTKKIDLVIVDGPSTDTSNYVRYTAIPVINEMLSKSYCIFLDDTKRPYEKEILLEWNIYLKGNLRYQKVYGTITKGDNFSTNPLSH